MRLIGIVLATAALSASCSTLTSEPEPRPIALDNRFTEYLVIRETVEEMYKSGEVNTNLCSIHIFDPTDAKAPYFRSMAQRYYEFERRLLASDIPEAVWKGDLMELERQAVAAEIAYSAVDQQFGFDRVYGFERTMNDAYRGSALRERLLNHFRIPDPSEDGFYKRYGDLDEETKERLDSFASLEIGPACGDGGLTAELRTVPSDARVFLSTQTDLRICERLGIDPFDTDPCQWREETGSQFVIVAGQTPYKVIWSDGSVSTGRRSFDQEAKEDHTVFLVRK